MPLLKQDSVSLFYEDTGSGGPPLLLVHGWGCDHTFMAPLLTHLCKEHRVVTLDLPGHGRSDKPRQAYTIPGFAKDVAWLCRELELVKPVVIGHSMGGAIALEVAAQEPALLAGCDIPTLYIASTHPRGDVLRFQQLCAHVVHGQVVSAGHFVQLEVPDQVNAMIERFLRVQGARDGGSI